MSSIICLTGVHQGSEWHMTEGQVGMTDCMFTTCTKARLVVSRDTSVLVHSVQGVLLNIPGKLEK